MQATIDIRLFANLAAHLPANAGQFPIVPGTTVGQVLAKISVPLPEAKLIFVNGVRAALETPLQGGERVGIFPPVGGG